MLNSLCMHRNNLTHLCLAPEEIIIKQSNPDKREITFDWIQPLKPNGIIRQYKTLVIDNRANCTKAVSRYSCNANKCDDSFDYTCPVGSLSP
jgi:hypothetical protein